MPSASLEISILKTAIPRVAQAASVSVQPLAAPAPPGGEIRY